MAEGLFGNIYDAQLQQQLLDQKAAQSYGTGWEAITRAAAGAGGMLGRGIGQALGGQTPIVAKQQALQGVAAQFPDLDPGDPEQLRKVQSALWQAGLYDQANQVGETAAGLEKTDILEEYYKGTVEAQKAKGGGKGKGGFSAAALGGSIGNTREWMGDFEASFGERGFLPNITFEAGQEANISQAAGVLDRLGLNEMEASNILSSFVKVNEELFDEFIFDIEGFTRFVETKFPDPDTSELNKGEAAVGVGTPLTPLKRPR